MQKSKNQLSAEMADFTANEKQHKSLQYINIISSTNLTITAQVAQFNIKVALTSGKGFGFFSN